MDGPLYHLIANLQMIMMSMFKMPLAVAPGYRDDNEFKKVEIWLRLCQACTRAICVRALGRSLKAVIKAL